MNFDTWMRMNPRSKLTRDEFKDFLEYAKKRYIEFDQVNWTSYEDEEERDELVEEHINDSMEALLLFKEFQQIIK